MTRVALLNMANLTRTLMGLRGSTCEVACSTQMLGDNGALDFLEESLRTQGLRVNRVEKEDGNTYLVTSDASRQEPTEEELQVAIEFYLPMTAKFVKPS